MGRVWLGADAPHGRGGRFPWQAYGWAAAMVVAVTLLNHLWFGRVNEANLIITYFLGMLPVALRGDRGAAIAATVLSVAAFDLFFVLPYHTFAVSDAQNLFTFAVMGLVGGIVSTLTARLAAETAEARRRDRRSRALYELSRALLASREPAEVLVVGARVLRRELGRTVLAWLKTDAGGPVAVGDSAVALATGEAQQLAWVLAHGEPAGPGTPRYASSSYLFLPVRSPRQIHGALGLRWREEGQTRIQEIVATLGTGANQLATAIEEARAQHDADQARDQAESERLRNALLSAVSHDLRTPLAGIVGAASSLADGAEALAPEVRRELATDIVEEAERLNRLVTNLLHATRLDAGPAQLHRDWTSIEELIAPALARLAAPLASHALTIELPPDLPLIQVDPVMLEQVFINLLENIAKHTPAGTPILIRARREDERLVVEVVDRGPGLPPGDEERVFEKFHRHPRSGAPGAGLGLAIVRGVLEAHGGRAIAVSPPEGGTCFRLELPLTSPAGTPRQEV